MTGRWRCTIAAMAGAFALAAAPLEAHAQARSLLGGLAGGVLGGVIAGAIIANSRPPVAYRRVVVRRAPAPRVRVARPSRAPAQAQSGAAVLNASADPFAKSGSATTAVKNIQ